MLPIRPPRSPITPYPRGWYMVCLSSELPVKGVLPLHYFDREIVAFRTEDGRAHVVDAHCPHLGAHLGHGGTVQGCQIRCPFHGWHYDAESGQCQKIPYAPEAKIPQRAQLRTWPVHEVSGLVMVYYDEEHQAPTWRIPDLVQEDGDNWTEWRETRWKVRARLQDVAENDLDSAHLPVLHQFSQGVLESKVETDGPRLEVHMKVLINLDTFGLSGTTTSPLDTVKYGLSYGYIRQSTDLGMLQIKSRTLGNTTPIDDTYLDMRLLHSIRKTGNPQMDEMIQANYYNTFKTAVDQDIVVWENKIYLTKPLLCEGDGPIGAFRKWSRQFYAEESTR